MREAEKIRAVPIRGGLQPVEKASQSLRPQAQIEFHSFSPAACTSEKILLGSQTCERKRVRCGEPQPFQTRAQRRGSRLRACQKYFFDKLKATGSSGGFLIIPPRRSPAAWRETLPWRGSYTGRASRRAGYPGGSPAPAGGNSRCRGSARGAIRVRCSRT